MKITALIPDIRIPPPRRCSLLAIDDDGNVVLLPYDIDTTVHLDADTTVHLDRCETIDLDRCETVPASTEDLTRA